MGRGCVGLWGALLGAAPALAQEPPAEVRSLREVEGAIASSVDLARGTLMLAEARGRVELRVDASTTILLLAARGAWRIRRLGEAVASRLRAGRGRARWRSGFELLEP